MTTPTIRMCAHCGQDVTTHGKTPKATYCSQACRKQAWRQSHHQHTTSPELAIQRLREPIPVQPFLDWAQRRAKLLKALYAPNDSQADEGLTYLLDDIGWPHENGMRRLHRWRTGDQNFHGYAERAIIEDALWRAGVFTWEVYPDLDDEEAA